jgi:hypothetical protein
MTNLTKVHLEALFRNIEQLQKFAEKRAYELLIAQGIDMEYYDDYAEKIEIEGNLAYVRFANRRCDYSDWESIPLSIDQLSMSEQEWKAFIEEEELKTLKKQEEEKRVKQENLLQQKIKQKESLEKEIEKLRPLYEK